MSYFPSLNTIAKIVFLFLIITSPILSQTEQDTVAGVQMSDSVYVMSKTPMLSVLLSGVVPGLGQIYNESYWKAPVVWGVLGYFAYVWIDNNDKYKMYRDLYTESLIDSDTGNRTYRDNRDFYLDQRDQFAVYFALAYLLNLVDAYVDAHLFDFNVSENPMTRTPQLDMRIHF